MAKTRKRLTRLNIPKVVIIYELVTGFFETISGLSLVLFGHKLLNLYVSLNNAELLESSHGSIAYLAEKLIPNLFEHRIYIALTLMAIGITKIISGIGILLNKWWADHLLVVLVLTFIVINSLESLVAYSIIKFIFLIVNILIFLYLVQFQPVRYLKHLLKSL